MVDLVSWRTQGVRAFFSLLETAPGVVHAERARHSPLTGDLLPAAIQFAGGQRSIGRGEMLRDETEEAVEVTLVVGPYDQGEPVEKTGAELEDELGEFAATVVKHMFDNRELGLGLDTRYQGFGDLEWRTGKGEEMFLAATLRFGIFLNTDQGDPFSA